MLENMGALFKALRYLKLPRHKKNELIKKRFQDVLISSYRHVPYYRNMMQRINYDPQKNFTGLKDLQFFPVTAKDELKTKDSSLFLMEGLNNEKLFFDCTSGSTGIPLKIYFSYQERAMLTANWIRMLFLNGYSPLDRYFTLMAPANSDPHINENLIQKFGFFRKNAVFYPRSPKKTVNIFLKYKPRILYGTRSYLDLIAYELIRRNVIPQGLKLVISGEEVLTKNHRKLYTEAFGADIVDAYGSAETTMIAHGIKNNNGLYPSEDIAFFEFLDEVDNPVKEGETGRIVVTSLINKVMPFIRYDIGDLAITGSDYSDNRNKTFKILEIKGRDNDNFILPDGSRIFYHDFYKLLFSHHHILQFQAVQKNENHIQVIIAAKPTYFSEILSGVKKSLKNLLPEEWTCEVVRQDFIEPGSSGKLRMLVSDLKETNSESASTG